MKSRHSTHLFLLPAAVLLVLLVFISGCATQKTAADTVPAESSKTDTDLTPLPSTGSTEARPMDAGAIEAAGRIVYFDYDRDDIKPEFRDLIAAHARFLRDNPQARVKLDGHADERGSREYNLALSERRAKAVLNQLLLAGVPEAQLSTAAFGEEYPAVKGHDEAAWSKNRRVEFTYPGSADGAAKL